MIKFTATRYDLVQIANYLRDNDHQNPLLGVINNAIQGAKMVQDCTILVTEFENQYLNELEI